MAEAGSVQLPVQLTTFVGRAAELLEVERLLARTRLLTLTGAGGSGKTRLALEAAARAAPAVAEHVACVELAPLADASRVPELVATSLGISEQPGRSATEALAAALRPRSLLLVLDNCEHVVDACAALADALLRACPGLRVLATSRTALGIGGETAWLVPPLSLPEHDVRSLDAAARAEAVQLFVARARDVRPDFRLRDENLPAVVQLCRRLDGIPLALELAAARLRSLSIEQLAARLDDRFRLLTTGSRTALPRQQTLRATIDWSYDLLGETERLLFARLAVFAGSFTLESAEAVCADDDVPPDRVLDLVSSLVEQSLVELVEHRGEARYRLLETVMQYAAERLALHDDAARVRARHARFYHGLVRAAEPHMTTPARPAWTAVIDRDFDNVRRVLAWYGEHDPAAQLALAGSLCWYWFATERWSEGRHWLEAALADGAALATPRDHAAALFAAGVIAGLQTDTAAALPWLEASIAISESTGDSRGVAYGRNYLGLVRVHLGRGDALEPLLAARDWFRESGDLYGLRLATLLIGTHHLIHGHVAEATQAMEEGVRVARQFGLPRELAISLQMLGTALFDDGAVDRAEALFQEALQALRQDSHLLFLARAIDMIGVVRSERGAYEDALKHFAAAAALRERIGAAPFLHDVRRIAPRLERARAARGAAAEADWAVGARRTAEDALAAALGPWPEAATQPAAASVERPAERRAALDVRALGPLEIVCDGRALTQADWTHLRPRELLLYLLCHTRGRTRDQVGLAFWPDASPAQVKNSFHVALHHLRRALGRADWIVFDGERYRVNDALGVDFDAARFETAMEAGLRASQHAGDASTELHDGLRLYRGDFLQDEQMGDWHLEHRDRLRRLFVRGMKAHGESLIRDGAFSAAADVFRRLVAIEDLDEDAHRQLITCLARTGQRGLALRHYDRLLALLQQELGAAPEPETRALGERLRRADAV